MRRDARRLTIALAVDPSDGTISGEIRDQGDRRRSFQGWLELISQLETWRATAVADSAKPIDRD